MDDGVSIIRIDHDTPERFTSLRGGLGVTAFGVNHLTLRPGERGRIHVHAHQEEVYLVMRGTLTVELQEGPVDLAEGGMMRVAPAVRRRLVNLGPGVCSLVAMGGAGGHVARDATAYRDWDDTVGGTPQEIPLPEDLPPSELRT